MMRGGGSSRTAWTQPVDVVEALRRRWETGVLPRALADGQQWAPFSFAVRGPTARQIAETPDAVRSWLELWRPSVGRPWRVQTTAAAAPGAARLADLTEDADPAEGSDAAVLRIPEAVWIDEPATAWTLLQVQPDVAWLTERLDTAARETPRLREWMGAYPLRVLALRDEWDTLMATVVWISRQSRKDLYLRQIDVPGVDTRFLERHRNVLTDLLDRQLPTGRIDRTAARAEFEQRFGFRRRPTFVRFRPLRGDQRFAGLPDLSVRSDDFAALAPIGARVMAVENEATYLAVPDLTDTVIVLGSAALAADGVAVPPWLAERELLYWGDIDTHGFAVLDRLRHRHPRVRSLLMDRTTLAEHRGHWSREDSPKVVMLDRLDDEEQLTYREITDNVHGPAVRLDSERVRMSALYRALRLPLGGPS
ncbi:Wadjet anti-phage system protein JetD domain-containing protein [Nakamurella flava]|nr:Wadjet anti-phage system protein JetD domain-containing protein [Nakamurella flava]